MLDDSDKDAMVANHLFFSRMTNIREVLLRLVSRGVISQTQKQQLVQKTNVEGTEKTFGFNRIASQIIYKKCITNEDDSIIRMCNTSIYSS